MARLDPHSYADDAQPLADMLQWRAEVDFSTRTIRAEAALELRAPASAGPLDLDTRDLSIEAVADQSGQPLPFELAAPEPILGARLRIQLSSGTRAVRIRYRTSPDATALQWLEPAQTAGKRQPFLYTQCQPIHARSVVPLQDTPRTRLRFEAHLRVPPGLTALMAAESLGTSADGAHFRLSQPISPYLFAFAVGELVSRDLGPRSRVWAEPALVEPAAWEFGETEHMLAQGEHLFGNYDWGRYDLLVLPPAFPYGGMENPRLTFVTPSVLAGDRSLVALVAHELAHSWTGNLISNANAEHFWLNEGGATYAERRIGEALWGVEVAALEWALGRRALDQAVRQLNQDGHPAYTRLRTHLAGVDPDDAYTEVPYEKGALFLRALEESAGRPAFDAFVRAYIDHFRFQAITTDQFMAFLRQHLPAAAIDGVDPDAWLNGEGIPANAPVARSARLDAIAALDGSGAAPSDEQARAWSAVEWQLYLEGLPPSTDLLPQLDARFGLTRSHNYDVLEKWLVLAIRTGYRPAFDSVEEVLANIGRMKYLRALYRALIEREDTRAWARELFERYASRYHPIARQVVAAMLER